ncbi:hypothetical protein ABK040_008774 [Willaertia magna]
MYKTVTGPLTETDVKELEKHVLYVRDNGTTKEEDNSSLVDGNLYYIVESIDRFEIAKKDETIKLLKQELEQTKERLERERHEMMFENEKRQLEFQEMKREFEHERHRLKYQLEAQEQKINHLTRENEELKSMLQNINTPCMK